jgi:HSP20 family protein
MIKNDDGPIEVAQKRELASGAEDMRPGPLFSPAVDIFEDENQITVLADMPGVTSVNLDVDLREGVLTLRGRVESPQSKAEEPVLSEWSTGTFVRQFTLSNTIDQAGIQAVLTDGVLRLSLPKIEAAKPRKVKVRTG